MKVNYEGKTVVVTGAAGAIGSAMCEAYAANGAKVVVGARNKEKGTALVEKIKAAGGKAFYSPIDVTSQESMKAEAEKIIAEFGTINVLVNNAGVNVGPDGRAPIHEFSDDNFDWITGVDLKGVYNCSKVFVPYIIKAGGGNVINISSVVGLVPFRNQCAFAAAKAAVVNLSKAMALELANEKVRVNVIAPGSIMFEGTRALFYNNPENAEKMMVNIPQHRPGETSDIANAALFVGSDEDASYMTGAVLTIDGGWTAGFARDF